MSELISVHNKRYFLNKDLLAGVSAVALSAYVASTGLAQAGDADRPTIWIELGGQLEMTQGTSAPFTAPFMSFSPQPDLYRGFPFIDSQKAAHFSIGGEGKIIVQPENSDWKLSVGIRYGRSNAKRHTHRQSAVPDVPFDGSFYYSFYGNRYFYSHNYERHFTTSKLADTQTQYSGQQAVLDFTAGKDVGLGLLGREGTSTINAGVRFASFISHSTALITARPNVVGVTEVIHTYFNGDRPSLRATFHQYILSGDSARSFRGIGPTVSWDSSAALVGNADAGELTLDWGINAALLFGKQKARVDHTTSVYRQVPEFYPTNAYPRTQHNHNAVSRAGSVVIPNLGGFAGFSVKYPNVAVSFGYRADFFFGAMDTGIDTRRTKDVGFHGPFATVSIGLGG